MSLPTYDDSEIVEVGPGVIDIIGGECTECPVRWHGEHARDAARWHALRRRHVVNVFAHAATTLWPWEQAVAEQVERQLNGGPS